MARPTEKEAREKRVRDVVGMRIRELRKLARLSQVELAERGEMDVNFLGGVERGERTPSIATLAHIAEALGVELTSLLDARATQEPREIRRVIDRRLDAMDPAQLIKVLRVLDAIR